MALTSRRLLREARIVAQREREKARQRVREAARERSRMSRAEYTAPARHCRSAATEMRRAGLSLRAIATALRCSLAEIQRVLTAGVQGSPGLSDFKGVVVPSSSSLEVTSDEQRAPDLVANGDVFASTPSAGNGGAIAAAIVSEYAASAHCAQPESDMTGDGSGVRGGNQRGRKRNHVYSSSNPRDYR